MLGAGTWLRFQVQSTRRGLEQKLLEVPITPKIASDTAHPVKLSEIQRLRYSGVAVPFAEGQNVLDRGAKDFTIHQWTNANHIDGLKLSNRRT